MQHMRSDFCSRGSREGEEKRRGAGQIPFIQLLLFFDHYQYRTISRYNNKSSLLLSIILLSSSSSSLLRYYYYTMFSATLLRRFTSSRTTATTSSRHHYPTGNIQWMPTLPLILLHATHATPTTPASAIFRIKPQMTKHEVKEYLTKIYNVPVVNVRTQNYLGKRMRIIGKRTVAYAKRPDYKKAFVTLDGSLLADVGMGSMVDGLPGQQAVEVDDEGGGRQQQPQIEA